MRKGRCSVETPSAFAQIGPRDLAWAEPVLTFLHTFRYLIGCKRIGQARVQCPGPARVNGIPGKTHVGSRRRRVSVLKRRCVNLNAVKA